SEQNTSDKVTLFCYVMVSGYCRYSVRWLYNGQQKVPSDMETSSTRCAASVSFTTSHFHQMFHEFLQWKLNKDQLFTFSSQASGDKTDVTRKTKNVQKQWHHKLKSYQQ
ncbi:hypothetical protein AMECASPLE_038253, partial [Ameca splendens]